MIEDSVNMLTFASLLEATRKVGIHGEERAGALDHLPKKLKGPKAPKRRAVVKPAAGRTHGVRRWDDARGDYLYHYD